MAETANDFIIPTGPDCEKIAKVIEDISDTMTIMEAKGDYIKEAKAVLKKKYNVPAKQITLMIKLCHNSSADKFFSDTEDSEVFYDKLFNQG